MGQTQLDWIKKDLIKDMAEEDVNRYLKEFGKPLEELSDAELDQLIMALLKDPINKGKIAPIFYNEIKDHYVTRLNAAISIVDDSKAKGDDLRSELIKITYQALIKKKCGKCS